MTPAMFEMERCLYRSLTDQTDVLSQCVSFYSANISKSPSFPTLTLTGFVSGDKVGLGVVLIESD